MRGRHPPPWAAPSALAAALAVLSPGCGCGRGEIPHEEPPELEDVLARWEAEMPSTFAGDPQPPHETPPREAVDLVFAFLGDPESARRQWARQELLERTETEAGAAAVREVLEDRRLGVEDRFLAVQLLGEWPPRVAAPHLLALLEDEEPVMRRHAAWLLGQGGLSFALPYLILRLRPAPFGELDPEARVWAADAVCRLGNPAGIPALIEVVRLPDERIQDLAGQRLVAVFQQEGLEYEPEEGWDALLERAWRLHEEWRLRPPEEPADEASRVVMARWIRRLSSTNLRYVDHGRFILARMGGVAAPLLAEAVLDRNQYIRIHSLEILRDLGRAAAAAAPSVRKLLSDPLAELYAVEVLGRIGDRDSLPAMVRRLEAPDLDLRLGALKGLAALGDPAVVRHVRPVFRDRRRSLEERIHAAFALAVAGSDARARQFLEETLARGEYHESTLREMLEQIP